MSPAKTQPTLTAQTGAFLAALSSRPDSDTNDATDAAYAMGLQVHALAKVVRAWIDDVQEKRREMVATESDPRGYAYDNRAKAACAGLDASLKIVQSQIDQIADDCYTLCRYGRDGLDAVEKAGYRFAKK